MPISGMTGFARVDGSLQAWTWTVEARSVNGRSLETRFRGPPGFDSLERVARDAAQSRLQRGQINVALQAKRNGGPRAVRVNLDQLESYLAIAGRLTAEGRAGPPAADGLLALAGVIETADDNDEPEARAAVEAAMAVSISLSSISILVRMETPQCVRNSIIIHITCGKCQTLSQAPARSVRRSGPGPARGGCRRGR